MPVGRAVTGIDIPWGALLFSPFPMSILINLATVFLILISLFLILVVLAQKAKSDGGMGAAMGGGMAEAAFGADTSNVLTKATINASIAFFVLSFLIYLGHVHQHKHAIAAGGALPTLPAALPPASPASSTPSSPAPAKAESTQAPAATPESSKK